MPRRRGLSACALGLLLLTAAPAVATAQSAKTEKSNKSDKSDDEKSDATKSFVFVAPEGWAGIDGEPFSCFAPGADGLTFKYFAPGADGQLGFVAPPQDGEWLKFYAPGAAALAEGMPGNYAFKWDDANGAATELFKTVNHGYLGVALSSIPESRTKDLKLGSIKGALVVRVLPDTPAARAGIRENDVITSVDGKDVDTPSELNAALRDMKPEQRVTLDVLRNGKRETLTATLAERPVPQWPRGARVWGAGPGMQVFRAAPRLGVSLIELTEQLREYFGVENGKGVLVATVFDNTAASRAGIKAGDVIVSVAGREVSRTGDISSELAKGGDAPQTVQVVVVRDRNRQTLSATVSR